jgi:osmoprotectant transport system permease protein
MASFSKLIDMYGLSLLRNIGIHLMYVVVSVGIGFFLGLILGILLSRSPKYSKIVLPILSIFNTIPASCSSVSCFYILAWSR